MLLNTFTTHDEFYQDFIRRINETTYWTDAQISSLTTLLADAMADIGVTNGYSARFAAREAFIKLARRKTSILQGARFLGVDIGRKSAAYVTCTVTNTTANKVTFDKYEPFVVGTLPALLSEITQWQPGETKTVDMIIATVFNFTQILTDVYDYMTVALGTENSQLTTDISVWTEDTTGAKTEYQRHTKAMFEAYQGQRIFMDATTDTGDVSIQFGGELWGTQPAIGQTLHVRGLIASGAAANTDTVGLKVQSVNLLTVAGKTTTVVAGGADEPPLSYYKTFAPVVGRSRKRLIRADEWKAAVMLYPDVADCVVMGQRDIAPNDKEWMGVVRLCVLPVNTSTWGGINPNPTSAAWTKFLQWLADMHPMLDVQTWNPTKLSADVVVDIALFSDAPGTRQSNEDTLRTAIEHVFSRSPGTLGKRLAVSDIIDAVKYDHITNPEEPIKRPEVDYVNVPSPIQDIIPNSMLEYVALRNLRVNISYSERSMK